MENKMENIYESKDKQVAPFLLTQPGIEYLGTKTVEQTVYFRFSPFDTCQQLVNDFMSRKAPLVQPKDLLDAVETFRNKVFEIKNK